jgi:hypothetical protein
MVEEGLEGVDVVDVVDIEVDMVDEVVVLTTRGELDEVGTHGEVGHQGPMDRTRLRRLHNLLNAAMMQDFTLPITAGVDIADVGMKWEEGFCIFHM